MQISLIYLVCIHNVACICTVISSGRKEGMKTLLVAISAHEEVLLMRPHVSRDIRGLN